VSLDYEIAPGTSGCLDVDEFRASVARQLGYDPFRPIADIRVVVHIGREETGFGGRIRWSDPRGHWVGDRRLSSQRPDCTEISASVVFSVTVEIQLMATLEPDAPKPPLPPHTVVTSSPQPEVRPPEPANRLELSVGLGPSLGLGLAPRPTGVGRVFVTGSLDQLSLEISVDAALPVTQREADGSGFSFDRFGASVAVCGQARPLTACLTAAFGRLEARGFGVDAPASPAGFFSQLGARIAATYDFGDRYFASPRVEPLVMVSRWTVTLNENAVWTTPRVGALIGLDFGARIF
jgi:hypothetical protein